MADLDDWQFELDGVTFGLGSPYRVLEFPPAKPDTRVQDRDNPRMDGTSLGRDYLTGAILPFDLGVEGTTAAETLDRLATLRRAWQADGSRLIPGEVVPLRIKRPGRDTVLVYGRPRRFTPASMTNVATGWVPVVADFQCVDHLFYADVQSTNTVTIIPPPSGGLEAPLAEPLSTVAVSVAQGAITVGGEARTPLSYILHGPITNPEVEVFGQWRSKLLLSIASDDFVQVDARPWVSTVLRSARFNVSGKFDADSPALPDLTLPPGDHVITLRGVDETGTASVTTVWRDAGLSW